MDRQQDSMSVVSCRATTTRGEDEGETESIRKQRQNTRSAVGHETVPEYWSTFQH